MLTLHRLLARLPAPLASLRERFDTRPVDSVDGLTHFVHTRAAYVGQVSLHNYLKARMGTSFRHFFTDEHFSRSIRIASMHAFLACLADLTIFTVATVARDSGAPSDEAAELARSCHDEAVRRCLDPGDLATAGGEAMRSFAARAALTDWRHMAERDHAFARSPGELVRMAPVVEEFRSADSPSVENAMRFRWLDVRRQFRHRVAAGRIRADWRRLAAAGGLDTARPARYD